MSVTITEGFGNHSESLLLFLFHGTEFRDVFSSAEGFGTEFRDFLFRGTAGIPSEITICSVYSVFLGIIFLWEIPNPMQQPQEQEPRPSVQQPRKQPSREQQQREGLPQEGRQPLKAQQHRGQQQREQQPSGAAAKWSSSHGSSRNWSSSRETAARETVTQRHSITSSFKTPSFLLSTGSEGVV